MRGFFSKEELSNPDRPDAGKTYSCVSCGLYKQVISPKMKPYGDGEKGILNLGEAPGQVEDERGRPWQGKSGNYLKRMYRRMGVDLFEDCVNLNTLDCRPTDDEGNNRAPSSYEIACCRSRTLDVIRQVNPKVIVVFGNSALEALLGHRLKSTSFSIHKWRGYAIPDRKLNAWICPVFHPSYILREDRVEMDTIWEQDIGRAMDKVYDPFPSYTDERERVEIIDDLSPLESINNLATEVSFDYETTGIKPHRKGHRIVAASVATEDKAYAFLMPKTRAEMKPFLDILTNPKIGKMAHNAQFEDLWTTVRLRKSVKPWLWDSMLASHIEKNRVGNNGLKFQTYVNFGVDDYSSEIVPYLKSTDSKDSNALNRIHQLIERGRAEDLLMYCGLDSVYEHMLAQKQREEIGYE